MATTNQPPRPYVDSKKVNKKVDYSKWERRDRPKPVKQKNTDTILWTVADINGSSTENLKKPGIDRCLYPPIATRRKPQNDTSAGKSQPNSDGVALPSTSNGSPKKIVDEPRIDPALLKKKDDNTKTLMLLLKSKTKTIKALDALCALVQERNQLIAQQIRATDKSSVQSADEFLDRHEKLGTSISAFNEWSQSEMAKVKNELKEVEEVAKKNLSALQKELSMIHAKMAVAQAELHILKTYKDKEYPVKVLMITDIKREIAKLEETQQDEYDDLTRFCQDELVKQTEENLQRQRKLLDSTVMENVSRVPLMIRRMALNNVTMKGEIEVYKKDIERLEKKNEELTCSVQKLKLYRKGVKEKIFEDVFTKPDNCTPDMEVVLNIPREEWLPI